MSNTIPAVSPHHKAHQTLHDELTQAKARVKVGGVYAHYKHSENHYKVLALGFREATDNLCVIYQAMYDEELIFIREIESWLEMPLWNGQPVQRFQHIETNNLENI